MKALKDKLALAVGNAVQGETRGLPPEWAERLMAAVPFRQLWTTSLLSCASAQWCGADPEAGLAPAAAILFLAGATASHAVPSVGVFIPCMEGYDAGGSPEAGRILAGDALFPLAVKTLCSLPAPLSLHLSDVLLRNASGILEAMSYGSHSEMAGSWNGRLASLAARLGAVSAGASAAAGETAALAGHAIGMASATLHRSPSRDALVDAEMVLRESLEPLGRHALLFHEIASYISAQGTGDADSLFAGLEPD